MRFLPPYLLQWHMQLAKTDNTARLPAPTRRTAACRTNAGKSGFYHALGLLYIESLPNALAMRTAG